MPSYIQSYSIHIASNVDAIIHTIIFNSMELLDFRGDLLVPQSSILHGNFHSYMVLMHHISDAFIL